MRKEKPTCFFIVSRVPFPPVGGDKLKYFNLIEILKIRFTVSVIVITDEKPSVAMKEYLETAVDSYKIFSYSKFRFRLNVIKTFFSSTPLQVGYYYFQEAHQYCKNRIKPGDFIMANLIRTALYVEDLPNTKFIDIADSIYLNYIRSINKVNSLFWRMVYRIEISRLKTFEQECISKFDGSLFANYDERNYYKNFGNAIWIPNGVNQNLLDKQYFKQKKSLFPEVVFLGKMDYQPNIDAVIWLVDKVLPLVPSLVIRIIGGSPASKILDLQKKRSNSVIIEGFVKDPYQLIYDATALVAPMQTGGGIQNKILEAMAIGANVLTTALGAKPIVGAIDREHLIVCDKAEEYAQVITDIHQNPKKFEVLGTNAKTLMKNSFTWKLYAEKLFQTLDSVNNRVQNGNA